MDKRWLGGANVRWVVESGLCHGCGACYAACPCDAIKMVNRGAIDFPEIDEHCTSCGVCNRVCSGHSFDRQKWHSRLYELLTSNEGIYLAHSRQERIHEAGASGGYITQYLVDLLEQGIIDGAIVAASHDGTLGGIRAVIAGTSDAVVSAAGSKYYPVSSCAALKDVRKGQKYAFVGKGCDMSSLRLMERVVERFKGVIYVRIGLLCAHTPYAEASRQLMKRHGFDPQRATCIYRGEGWPGQTILRDSQREVRLALKDSWSNNLGRGENCPYRCALCTDSFAESADIAVGDAWALNPDLEDRMGGTSMVLAYTENGKAEIARLKQSNTMALQEADADIVLGSQPTLIAKYETAHYRQLVLRLFARISPLSHLGYWESLRIFWRFVGLRGLRMRRLLGALRFVIFGWSSKRQK